MFLLHDVPTQPIILLNFPSVIPDDPADMAKITELNAEDVPGVVNTLNQITGAARTVILPAAGTEGQTLTYANSTVGDVRILDVVGGSLLRTLKPGETVSYVYTVDKFQVT